MGNGSPAAFRKCPANNVLVVLRNVIAHGRAAALIGRHAHPCIVFYLFRVRAASRLCASPRPQ